MNTDWLKNPHRTETFVFNFRDEIAFEIFWATYIKNSLECGVYASTMAKGDKIKLLDDCQNCLYEAMDRLPSSHYELAERMGKLAES